MQYKDFIFPFSGAYQRHLDNDEIHNGEVNDASNSQQGDARETEAQPEDPINNEIDDEGEYNFDENHVHKPMHGDGEDEDEYDFDERPHFPEDPNENYIDDDSTFDDEVNDAYDLIHSDDKEMDSLPQYLSKALKSLRKGK